MKRVIEAGALKVFLRMPEREAASLREKLKLFPVNPHTQPPWAKAFVRVSMDLLARRRAR